MAVSAAVKKIILKGIKVPAPNKVAPMLCTLVKTPVSDPEYIHEVKWDGYRIISYANDGVMKMHSRSSLDYTKKYPPVVEAIKSLKQDVVLDGEVCVLNEEVRPDFDAIQKYNGHNTPIYYYVFDILWLNGYNLMKLPLIQRKEILKSVVAGNKVIRYSESFDDGVGLYSRTLEMGMEGIVSKKRER